MTVNVNNNPVLDVQRENLTLAALLDLHLNLGARAARELVQDVITSAPEDLMTEQRQQVWRAARDIAVAGGVPTLSDVRRRPELRAVPADVWEQVEAAAGEAFGADLRENVTQLTATAQRRRLHQLGQQMLLAARSGEDVSASVAEFNQQLAGVMSGNRGRSKGAGEFGSPSRKLRAEKAGAIKAYSTGIMALNIKLGSGGTEKAVLAGKLMLVGGKFGEGKTRFWLQMAVDNARRGIRQMVLSGEMKDYQLPEVDDGGNVLCDEDGLPVESANHDIVDALSELLAGVKSFGPGSKTSAEEELDKAHAWLTETDIIRVYDDEFTLATVRQLAEECRQEQREIMYIDNLTHIMRQVNTKTGRKLDPEEEHVWYKWACEELQKIAKSTGVLIVALFQASVTAQVAAGRAPTETELGASRGIGQAASYVITLGRDADRESEGDVTPAEVRVVKNRYPRRRTKGGTKGLVPNTYWRSSTGTWVSDYELAPGEKPEEDQPKRERISILEDEERKLRAQEEKKQVRAAAREHVKEKLKREKEEAAAAQAAADRAAEEEAERRNLWERADAEGGAQ